MLTDDQAKKYLAEFRRLAGVASNSANAAIRAGRDAVGLADAAARKVMAARFAAMAVQVGDPGTPPVWDDEASTLTIPQGVPGQGGQDGADGTSIVIRTATPETAPALSIQYPNDLIVVPA